MNNPFEYVPERECDEAFRELVGRIEALRESGREEDREIYREFEEGKMLGVLIAEDKEGVRHTHYAFSGQLGNRGFRLDGFVEPVFDYLAPDGYFKTNEAKISAQNREIARFETGPLAEAKAEYEHARRETESLLAEEKEKYREAKLERARRRSEGVSAEEEAEMIRRSRFGKAELRRLKKRLEEGLAPVERKLKEAEAHLETMKSTRRGDSERLQAWLFDNFRVLNAEGETRSLSELFAETPPGIPPSGAGECCAPKLLQSAYLRGWKPLAIAEYWYGRPKGGEVRIHGRHYSACRGKCLPVLTWMLRGLEVTPPLENKPSRPVPDPEIIFENEWFCVVNKPSGMLSVPGKGGERSVAEWLEERYGKERDVKPVHRLDRDTSGLLVASFGPESFRTLQSLFATRRVLKTYVADLEGDYEELGLPKKGRVELPLIPDILDRPRQKTDLTDGKEAVTDYEFIGIIKPGNSVGADSESETIGSGEVYSRVLFYPRTGRTHQLRVHAASPLGLGMPIVGDRLYNRGATYSTDRLRLHALTLTFTFPLDGRSCRFDSPLPF